MVFDFQVCRLILISSFELKLLQSAPGGKGAPLHDLNGDVRPDRVWFSGCFFLNGVSISSLSVLNRVSLHDLMAKTRN